MEIRKHIQAQEAIRSFCQVNDADPKKMEVLTEIFNRILVPLYGPQEKALNQIREGKDRTAYLLYEGDSPVGVLVFKIVLSNEFAEYGIKNSIEIKSLFVDQSVKNSGRGLGSALVDKLKEEAPKLGLSHAGYHVTVSATKRESLAFFRCKGFEIEHRWVGKYLDNTSEFLLHCPAAPLQESKSFIDLSERFKRVPRKEADRLPPELFHVIHNAHFGDIHALRMLSDGTFISGSKDNTIKKWDLNGRLVKIVEDVEPHLQDERDWITNLQVVNNDYFISGKRNGKVSLWKTGGEYAKNIFLKFPKGTHVSKDQNKHRLNCFAKGLKDGTFFAGFPTKFDEYNFFEAKTVSYQVVDPNDWVYAIHPLTQDRLLAVIGCSVQLWERKKNHKGWDFKEKIVPEGDKVKVLIDSKWKYQRPFISALSPLNSSENQFSLAAFDGAVKVFDLQTKKIVNHWQEHVRRVWTIEPLMENVFASCGEDRSIKIWDIRQGGKSVHTISDHVGEVTSLMTPREHILLAGTCPNEVLTGKSGAEIRFYDIRY